ncbi:MAG: DUF4249 domain-containing protein [Sphingobacteriaceae bacterium]
MNKYLLKPLILLLFVVSQFGCKKIIDIRLKDAKRVIVIEGNVTDNTDRQVVTISKSIPFTEPNYFPAVSGAEVSITDNTGVIKILLEQMPGVYVTTDLKGEPTKTYQLQVNVDGQTYTASSTMPEVVPVDSIGIVATTFFEKKYNSVEVYYQDPEALTNYYRFKLWINGVLSKTVFIYNDNFTNGKPVKRELRDFDNDMVIGDEIKIEMHGIDESIYKYWSGISQNGNRGQASTTPANPVSNLNNRALGYFSAHAVQQKTFLIK